jgi:hypothetical protein
VCVCAAECCVWLLNIISGKCLSCSSCVVGSLLFVKGGGDVDGDDGDEDKHETEEASAVSHFAQQKAGKRPQEEESAVFTNHFNVVKPLT